MMFDSKRTLHILSVVSAERFLCSGGTAGIYVMTKYRSAQLKVAQKRFTATLSSNCVKHNETLRF
jgi:hypothetical protein